MKRKIFAGKTKIYRILFFTGIGISLFGLAVAVTGGVFLERYGEDTVWANAIFGCGMAVLVLGVVPILLGNFAERRKQKAMMIKEARTVSEDDAYACPLGILVFSEAGMKIQLREKNPFAELDQIVPYGEVSFFRTYVRKNPQDKGKEVIIMRTAAKNFTEHEFGEEEEEPAEFAVLQIEDKERFLRTAEKYKITVIDYRTPPVLSPVLVRKFPIPSRRVRRIINLCVMLVAIIGIGIGVSLLLSRTYENAASIVTPVCSALSVVAVMSNAGKIKADGQSVKLCIFKSGLQITVGVHRRYFPWEEIECVERTEINKQGYVIFRSPYSEFSFPDAGGLYGILENDFPDKCKRAEEETAA